MFKLVQTVWVVFRNYLQGRYKIDRYYKVVLMIQCRVLNTEQCQVFCAQYSNVSEKKLIFGSLALELV